MVRLLSAVKIRDGLDYPFLFPGLEFGKDRQREDFFCEVFRNGHIAPAVAKIRKAGLEVER
jgi:hypothetical protein